MDGPPGTGKSQTIANLIAELLANGKSVLFVSEKSAALDVVANRLAGRGLDDFLFELHDHRTKRRQAAQELGRALRSHPRVDNSLRDVDIARAERVRGRLTDYAEAVNQLREPLGRSAHWVLGQLSQLHESPRLTPGPVDATLSAAAVAELDEAFERMARRWRPAVDPESLVWHGVERDGAPAESLSRQARELRDAIDEVAATSSDLATACGLPEAVSLRGAQSLAEVAAHCVEQPWTSASWWKRDDVNELRQRVTHLAEVQLRHTTTIEALRAAYADTGRTLDAAWDGELQQALDRLALLTPRPLLGDDDGRESAEAQHTAARQLAGLADRLETVGAEVADALGASGGARSLERLAAFAEVAEHADAPDRPEPSWTAPAIGRQVAQAIEELAPLQADHANRAAALRDTFEVSVLDLDLRGLTQRFAHSHKGLRKLSSGYRADKREVARVTRSGKATREVLDRLGEALAWQESAQRLDAADDRHRSTLGRFAHRRNSQLDKARAALDRIELARERLGDDYDPAVIAAQLAGDQPQDLQLGTRAARLRQLLAEARGTAKQMAADPARLDTCPPGTVRDWATTVTECAERIASTLARIDHTRLAPATIRAARADLQHRAALREVDVQVAATADADEADLGSAYRGIDTDTEALDIALAWVEELQRRHGGPLPTTAVDALHGRGPAVDPALLAGALDRFADRRARLVAAFAAPRQEEVDRTLGGQLPAARDLAHALADRGGEIDDWRSYQQGRDDLEAMGWREQLNEAAALRITPEQLSQALRRAMWAAWIEAASASDPLLNIRADDLDAWVQEFRELDRAVLDAAAERVVEACNGRRPRSSYGATSIIEREASKKRKHMPVRDLLAKTDDVALALKPCFMMSPLTVSQFLPPNFTFDVVIFDEASQVTPADAVNCIYRGRQLVVTGDDKQLPPTNFFDLSALDGDSDQYDEDELDEFESIITQCKSAAGMPSLPLRWHYRSQHEDLITFSNYQYYAPDNQRLHTFPGARTAGDDLGVHLFQVDGNYRRGGPRDNPKEADHVAERVRIHAERILAQPSDHRETVGVVAFSVAQADAIEHRIDQLRQDEPHLDEFFAADRLDGFFVKNLENVQGDERDTMIFSIGYGPDEHGALRSQFGPLSGAHGHRRLNVAITRARRRVEVVCSFAPGQLNTSTSTHRGVPDLKRYLEYASQGLSALGIDPTDDGGDLESPFEESVFDVIRGWGYAVVPQVGVAGYRIDLGVRHPDEPDRYAIGIECDGRAYHSTRVARDRDRLRADVLRGLGWRLHRIWGPAWYRDREREAQRLREAIERAIDDGSPRSKPEGSTERRRPPRRVEKVEPIDPLVDEVSWTRAYQPVLPPLPEHDHPAEPGAFRETVQIVRSIIDREAPLHFEVLARRVADTFERSLTDRLRGGVSDALLTLTRQGGCHRDGDWIRAVDEATDEVVVRVPTAGEPDILRDVEHIPPEELAQALLRLAADACLITEEELLTTAARLFGWGRTTQRIHATLHAALERLVESERLWRDEDGMIRPA
jgi:very-short-patch-repair endonuclease